jgi:hypothetical protein
MRRRENLCFLVDFSRIWELGSNGREKVPALVSKECYEILIQACQRYKLKQDQAKTKLQETVKLAA